MNRHRSFRLLVTVAAIALAGLPAVVAFRLGWLTFGHLPLPADGSAPSAASPLEAWVLFSLFYLAWLLGLMVVVVWAYDRLGHHWRSWDRAPRTQKKRRRRLAAGMDYLARRERAGEEPPGRRGDA